MQTTRNRKASIGIAGLIMVASLTAESGEENDFVTDFEVVAGGSGRQSFASPSPDGRYLAYTDNAGGRPEIVLLELETGARANVGPGECAATHPNWAPDGNSLVFFKHCGDNSGIAMLELEGGNIHEIPWQAGVSGWPDISPDGSSVLFGSNHAGNWDVWTVHLASGEAHQVTSAADNEWWPRWHPDGDRVVFYSTWEDWTNIRTVTLDEEQYSVVAMTEFEDYRPVASANGDFVFYISNETKAGEIWRSDVDGQERKQITDLKLALDYPSVTADGRHIYATLRSDSTELSLFDLETGESEALVRSGPQGGEPTFSPDGQQVAYHVIGGNEEIGTHAVYVVDVTSGESRMVIADDANSLSPTWISNVEIAYQRGFGDYISSRLAMADVTSGSIDVVSDWPTTRFPEVCGDSVFFLSAEKSYSDELKLVRRAADGTEVVVSDGPFRENQFGCSSDGSEVVVASIKKEFVGLRLVTVATGDIKNIMLEFVDVRNPTMSPDGSRVVFAGIANGSMNLFVYDLADAETQQLTDSRDDSDTPNFSADGRQIVYVNRHADQDVIRINLN